MNLALKRLFQMYGSPPPDTLRFGQCWEDAEVVMAALDLQTYDRVLCTCSGGDTALALLGAGADRVIAVDSNPDQIACLALRRAAYLELDYTEFLEFMGSLPSWRRRPLYVRCRRSLNRLMREYWDGKPHLLDHGISDCGRFEARIRWFRRWCLPWLHSKETRERLFQYPTRARRERFFSQRWDDWRWRLLMRILFSHEALARLGCDPVVHGTDRRAIQRQFEQRLEHVFTALNPNENPYLTWMLAGTHRAVLPWALREENYDFIRQRLDHLEWHAMPVEEYLKAEGFRRGPLIDKINLGGLFERLSPEHATEVLERAGNAMPPGGRVVYWNLFKSFRRPECLDFLLRPLDEHARALFVQDRIPFHKDLVIEERI